MARRSRLHGLLCNFVKSSGYVRGYLPELLSHATSYTGTMPRYRGGGSGLGKLALIGTIAAGAYYLYNKYKKKELEDKEDDDANYTKVPEGLKVNGPSDSIMNWDDNYYWGDTDESDYDDDIPYAVPPNAMYSGASPEIKMSSYRPKRIVEWLHK